MAPPRLQEERRAQILDGLFAAAAQIGLRGASVSEIAAASGIPRGALHYFFASKGEMEHALIRRLGERYVGNLRARLDAARDTGKACVPALIRWHFGGDLDDTARLMAVWIDYWGDAAANEGVRREVQAIQQSARTLFDEALAHDDPRHEAQDAGARRARAAAVLALVEGGLLQWRVARDGDESIDPQAFARAACALATGAA